MHLPQSDTLEMVIADLKAPGIVATHLLTDVSRTSHGEGMS